MHRKPHLDQAGRPSIHQTKEAFLLKNVEQSIHTQIFSYWHFTLNKRTWEHIKMKPLTFFLAKSYTHSKQHTKLDLTRTHKQKAGTNGFHFWQKRNKSEKADKVLSCLVLTVISSIWNTNTCWPKHNILMHRHTFPLKEFF